jgi:hypothetical protein
VQALSPSGHSGSRREIKHGRNYLQPQGDIAMFSCCWLLVAGWDAAEVAVFESVAVAFEGHQWNANRLGLTLGEVA